MHSLVYYSNNVKNIVMHTKFVKLNNFNISGIFLDSFDISLLNKMIINVQNKMLDAQAVIRNNSKYYSSKNDISIKIIENNICVYIKNSLNVCDFVLIFQLIIGNKSSEFLYFKAIVNRVTMSGKKLSTERRVQS